MFVGLLLWFKRLEWLSMWLVCLFMLLKVLFCWRYVLIGVKLFLWVVCVVRWMFLWIVSFEKMFVIWNDWLRLWCMCLCGGSVVMFLLLNVMVLWVGWSVLVRRLNVVVLLVLFGLMRFWNLLCFMLRVMLLMVMSFLNFFVRFLVCSIGLFMVVYFWVGDVGLFVDVVVELVVDG